jgi:AraC-like DNA-binding protein
MEGKTIMINSLTFHESEQHGTLDFPAEYFYLDANHPRYNMAFHWHKEWEIIHVLEGTFTAHADDAVFVAHAGDTVLIRDGMLHGGTPDNCVYECFLFDLHGLFRNLDMVKKYLRPVYRQQILPEIFYPAAQTPQVKEIIRNLTHAYNEKNSPLELVVISCISQLFALILQNGYYTDSSVDYGERPHKIDLIKSVLEYTELHYASPITLDDLAKVAGMNPRYFCRFFRSITHQTPIEYVNMYRIEKAAQMLHSTRLPITDICMECGFNDSSNFIKVFRKYKGMTPKQYRKV